MCGIAGLFLKRSSLEPQLGSMLSRMLTVLSDRGPDSAGFAVYGRGTDDLVKLTLRLPAESEASDAIVATAKQFELKTPAFHANHVIVSVPAAQLEAVQSFIRRSPSLSGVEIVGSGTRMEIYKDVGLPDDVARRFDLAQMSGTHAIGHTRMATELAVTTKGAHPFSTGADQCLVHNGSLSNHNGVRRSLQREGLSFETDNDTEVAAGYLTWRMREGASLKEALDAESQGSRRILHLRRRHRIRLWRAARSDRVQAGSDGRDRRLCRIRLRVSRACRTSRASIRRASSSRSPQRSMSGSATDAECRSFGDHTARPQRGTAQVAQGYQ